MPPFDWLDYLGVSADLLAWDDEGHLRASAGRSYYGVFGALRLAIEKRHGYPLQERSVHRQVINTLRRDGRPAVVALGRDLEILRRRRVHADYSQQPFVRGQALVAYEVARRIQERMAAF